MKEDILTHPVEEGLAMSRTVNTTIIIIQAQAQTGIEFTMVRHPMSTT
jgi:hypothetical protein